MRNPTPHFLVVHLGEGEGRQWPSDPTLTNESHLPGGLMTLPCDFCPISSDDVQNSSNHQQTIPQSSGSSVNQPRVGLWNWQEIVLVCFRLMPKPEVRPSRLCYIDPTPFKAMSKMDINHNETLRSAILSSDGFKLFKESKLKLSHLIW